MERKIGEIFEDRGVIIQCVKTEGRIFACDHCFYGIKWACQTIDECCESERSDETYVHFIEVKPLKL